jgi:hypothetical protein
MLDANGHIIEMTVKDYIPYVSIDQKKKKGQSSRIEKILNIICDECSTSELTFFQKGAKELPHLMLFLR